MCRLVWSSKLQHGYHLSDFHVPHWHLACLWLSLCVCVCVCRGKGCLLLEGKGPVLNGVSRQSEYRFFFFFCLFSKPAASEAVTEMQIWSVSVTRSRTMRVNKQHTSETFCILWYLTDFSSLCVNYWWVLSVLASCCWGNHLTLSCLVTASEQSRWNCKRCTWKANINSSLKWVWKLIVFQYDWNYALK